MHHWETPLPTPTPASPDSANGLFDKMRTQLKYWINQELLGTDLLPDTDDLELMKKLNGYADRLDVDELINTLREEGQ